MKPTKISYQPTTSPMTTDQMMAELKKIESDDRLWYEAATVFANAPLALIQMSMATKASALRMVMGLPQIKYFK